MEAENNIAGAGAGFCNCIRWSFTHNKNAGNGIDEQFRLTYFNLKICDSIIADATRLILQQLSKGRKSVNKFADNAHDAITLTTRTRRTVFGRLSRRVKRCAVLASHFESLIFARRESGMRIAHTLRRFKMIRLNKWKMDSGKWKIIQKAADLASQNKKNAADNRIGRKSFRLVGEAGH